MSGMKDTFGIIYTGENDQELREITRSRSIAAMPFGGRYRIIDAMLSNYVASGITNVGIITQRRYHSLMDHMGAGDEWDLNRKRDGLFILPPFATRANTGEYRNLEDAVRSNLGYIRRSEQRYVILSTSHILLNTSFDDMLEFHQKNRADITVMYHIPDDNGNPEDRILLETDEDGRITDVEDRPRITRYNKTACEVYLMEKSLLLYLVEKSQAYYQTNFVKDFLYDNLKEMRIFGYEYDGYVARVEKVQDYMKLNLDMIDQKKRQALLNGAHPVYTKTKDEVPAKYEAGAKVKNSLIADGCLIEGTVENCVLFRGVRIGRNVMVRNCVLMQSVDVQDGATLEYVIADKDSILRRNSRLIGQESYPIILGKNAVV